MPLTASERSTRWRKKHPEHYRVIQKAIYDRNFEKEMNRNRRNYYWNKESQRLRNILLEF